MAGTKYKCINNCMAVHQTRRTGLINTIIFKCGVLLLGMLHLLHVCMGISCWVSQVPSVVASIYSPSSCKLSLSLNWAGVGTLALILRAMPTAIPTDEPMDMELLEPELCSDPLASQFTPVNATFFTWDPGAKLRRVFSFSVTENRA